MIRIEDKNGSVQGYLPDSPSAAGIIGELFSAAGTREEVVVAGADFTVPEYMVGAHRLEVFLDGLRCVCGETDAAQYTEVGSTGTQSTIIRWHDNIPADCDILVRVI
ncbi:MAG: hypothetical protein DBY37_10690 [Desulfovibrionaceae bacterium]|nr:MAG: hypothetical protein DBY37_10690 [Desulfovibrionaceae bacterium]